LKITSGFGSTHYRILWKYTLFTWCNCFICVKIRSFYSNNMHSFFFIETYLKAKIDTGIYSLTCIKQSPLGQRVVLNSHIWDKGLFWTVSLGQRVVLNSQRWLSIQPFIPNVTIQYNPLSQRDCSIQPFVPNVTVQYNPLSQRWMYNRDKGLYWTVTIGTKGCIEQSLLGQSVIEQSPLGQRVVLKSLTTYLLKISQSWIK
jgi:hypothetical protein